MPQAIFKAFHIVNASNITNARVSVIGLGKSGLASCRLLKNKGAKVFASDNSEIDKKILKQLKALDIDFETAHHTEKCFKGKDFIITSPGVLLNCFPLNEAQKRNIPIYSEIELGFWFIHTPIVAITGTNGKTTTVTLLGEMFKAIGKKVTLCGNIGLPLCMVALDDKESDVIVMEVSSSQLETIKNFRPKVGVLLNITPNHLDRYSGNISAYTQAKANLFKNQGEGDFAILNGDDDRVRKVSIPRHVKKIYFSNSTQPLKLPGRHNLSNASAACSVISCLFPEERGWLNALTQFRGLPHRLERIRKIKDVTFINDSKATSVDACLKAIESISAPIILIAGGRDKDSPFELLRRPISDHVKRLILIGESKDKMARILRDTTEIHMAATLKEAVLSAFSEAVPGDYVLLSPACASFDMFKNFEERGEKFKEIVKKMGTVCHGNN